jgi:beta-glucosidase
MSANGFPPHFRFGAATAAIQIEGASDARGESIWDRFSRLPGRVADGGTPEIACDHYHRWPEDLDLIAALNVESYRFSIAWPRIQPTGSGAVNQAGVDFYRRLVEGMLERGIEPIATLYHWDLPQALEDEGGWLERGTCDAFAEYTAVVADRLGDRVALWLTHNEPWCQAFLGYQNAFFAPGKADMRLALTCAHHLLVSHGLAVQALRSRVRTPIGIAPNFMPAHPATESEVDIAAAARQDGYFNRWFIEPVLGLGYPADMVELYGALMPRVDPGDMAIIAQPIDVVGVNYYERSIVGDDPKGGLLRIRRIRQTDLPRTADREIYAPGLREILDRLHQRYNVPRIVITENGAATRADEPIEAGRVHDRMRVDFLRAHLEQVAEARRAGVPVDGYFAWSLMDNFEWTEGYTLRYGIVHVDFETQVRTPKDSAHFVRSLSQRAAQPEP